MHLVKNLLQFEVLALFYVFFPAAFRSRFRGGFKKNFQIGIRKDHRPYITPLHHDTTACSSALLFRYKYLANPGDRRHSRRSLRDFICTNRLCDIDTVEQHTIVNAWILQGKRYRAKFDARGARQCLELRFRTQCKAAILQRVQRNRTIHRAAVQINVPEFLGD